MENINHAYRIVLEHWKIWGIDDLDLSTITKEKFFECATNNKNGMESDEEIAVLDTIEKALEELKKYRCTYEKLENFNETCYELYAVEELIYDENGDIEDYKFIKYAEIDGKEDKKMKKADLHFVDEDKTGYSFIMQCLFKNAWENGAEEHNKFINSLIAKSSDTNDFVSQYLDKDTAIEHNYYKSQCYQAMLRRYGGGKRSLWYYYREMFGDKCRKTVSDAGALKIGNDDFKVLFRNGYGDGITRYAILSKDEFYADSQIMTFETSFEGKAMCVYSYDCGDDVDYYLANGRYGVYSYEGLVALVKWE